MRHEIEPLESSLWFARIELIAWNGLGGIENSLRHAGHLMQLAPASFRGAAHLEDEDAFEALLDTEDFDVAARCLVHPDYLDLRESKGEAAAWIACPMLERTVEGAGRSAAEAVLDAWSKRLLALRDACGGARVGPADRVARALTPEPAVQLGIGAAR